MRLDGFCQLVDLGTAVAGQAFCPNPLDLTALGHGPAEDAKARAGYQVTHVDQLHAKAQVRVVLAKTIDRFPVGKARKRLEEEPLVADFFDDACVHLFDEPKDVFPLDEAHLQVELRELGLAIASEVFVTEAACDLEVTLEAGDHQELLDLLR